MKDDPTMTDLNPLLAYDDEPTKHGGVHHPYSAFNQGYAAASLGYPDGMCPYEEDSREGRAWMDGHRTCREQSMREHLLPPSAPLDSSCR